MTRPTLSQAELRETMTIATNLYTIRLALQQCPEFTYLTRIREANDVAILAIEAKLELYFTTQTK